MAGLARAPWDDNRAYTYLMVIDVRAPVDDQDFGHKGWVWFAGQYPRDVLIDSSGRVVITCSGQVRRYLRNGDLDQSFGEDGVLSAAALAELMGGGLTPRFVGTCLDGEDLIFHIARPDGRAETILGDVTDFRPIDRAPEELTIPPEFGLHPIPDDRQPRRTPDTR